MLFLKGTWKVIGVMGPNHAKDPRVQTCTQYHSNSTANPTHGFPWTCHWLLIYETNNNGHIRQFVVDFDSSLRLYVPAQDYFYQSFPRDGGCNNTIYFRGFEAATYVTMNRRLAASNPYWYLNQGTALSYNKFTSMLRQ